MMMWLVIVFLIVVGIIDWRYRLVLNAMVIPAALALLLISNQTPALNLPSALAGGLIGFGLFAAVAMLRPGQLGGGDVKLAAVIGILFGFPLVFWALIAGVLAGGVAVCSLLFARHAQRSARMPYAPFLCAGAIVLLALRMWT